jgi:5-methylcytosine-specific restriction enzyme A
MFYGKLGKGIAVVHHLEQFNLTGEIRTATVDDVRVVCANCHAVIHAEETPVDVDELKARLSRVWGPWIADGIKRNA